MAEMKVPKDLATNLRAMADIRVFNSTSFKDARALMRRSAQTIDELSRLLGYAITKSNARYIFSDGFIADASAALAQARGEQKDGKDTAHISIL